MDRENIDAKENFALTQSEAKYELADQINTMLQEWHPDLITTTVQTVSFTQMSTLGAAIAELVPAFRTATQSVSTNASGLYRLANESAGDVLKVAKDGTYWGAFKTAGGGSKFVKLQEAGSVTSTATTVLPINPATMFMAAALASIDQKLDAIAETEKQILTFLETEKEAKIEADVKTLGSIVSGFKYNWDNELYVSSNHKMVLDIQRDARANMISYRRTAAEQLKAMKPLVEQKKVETALESLVKMFQYYKLSLFSYSLASMLEILLSGNYKEGYISDKSSELEQYVVDYRELFSECSMYLESLSDASLQQKILKGVGFAGKAVGKAIGAIPVIKNGPVDEFLIEKGTRIAENAESMKEKTIRSFARLSDPNVRMFIAKMDDMVRIFNHTSEILFDDKQMYLIAA